jgi:hypothetical protein
VRARPRWEGGATASIRSAWRAVFARDSLRRGRSGRLRPDEGDSMVTVAARGYQAPRDLAPSRMADDYVPYLA